jgi:hypothetical protein
MESTSQVLNPVSNQDFLRNTLNGIYQENDVTASSRVMSRRPLHHILIGVILFIFSGFMMVLMFNNLDQSKLPYIGRAVIASSLGCYYFTKKTDTHQIAILTQIHIKGTIVSLRNILLTVCCVEIQIVTKQYIYKYMTNNLL